MISSSGLLPTRWSYIEGFKDVETGFVTSKPSFFNKSGQYFLFEIDMPSL